MLDEGRRAGDKQQRVLSRRDRLLRTAQKVADGKECGAVSKSCGDHEKDLVEARTHQDSTKDKRRRKSGRQVLEESFGQHVRVQKEAMC